MVMATRASIIVKPSRRFRRVLRWSMDSPHPCGLAPQVEIAHAADVPHPKTWRRVRRDGDPLHAVGRGSSPRCTPPVRTREGIAKFFQAHSRRERGSLQGSTRNEVAQVGLSPCRKG
jgi:hypothetical protein